MNGIGLPAPRWLLACLVPLLLAGVHVGHATASTPAIFRAAPDVSFSPARPRQGALFTVIVRPDGMASDVEGRVAGEPLHFERDSTGRFTALAAVPVDSIGTLGVTIVVLGEDIADTSVRTIPIEKGDFRLERLTVAPRFGRAPDSVTRARMADEGRRAREVAIATHATPRLWEPPFQRPRPGRVTSPFGRGRQFNGQVTSQHLGTDFAGAVGAPVRAVNRGVVRIVDAFFLGGNVVYLDHGAGLLSAYLHLSKADVAVGDTVERGDVVGRVGATGRVTGPHLHLIARFGTVTVDPMSLLSLGATTESTSGEQDRP